MPDTFLIEHLDGEDWLQGVQQCRSPNHDERPDGADISLLVVHGISLPPGQYGNDYVEQLFTNRLDPDEHEYFARIRELRVSAHALIHRSGEITQFVPFNLRAWHAGESEFCGRTQCNDFSIGIEMEGVDDEPYELVQYKELAHVAAVLMQTYPAISEQRIVGHEHIAPGRKTDPGPAFNWDHFFATLTGINGS